MKATFNLVWLPVVFALVLASLGCISDSGHAGSNADCCVIGFVVKQETEGFGTFCQFDVFWVEWDNTGTVQPDHVLQLDKLHDAPTGVRFVPS